MHRKKPKRDKCRVAARYDITVDGFNMTRSGYECDDIDDVVYMIISCREDDGSASGAACRLPAASAQRALFEYSGSLHNESDVPVLDGADSFNATYGESTGALQDSGNSTDPAPRCQSKALTFTYSIT